MLELHTKLFCFARGAAGPGSTINCPCLLSGHALQPERASKGHISGT